MHGVHVSLKYAGMKTLFYISIVALAVLTIACDDNNTSEPESYVRCLIDGKPWEADVLANAVHDAVLGNFSVHGSHEESQTSLNLNANDIPGPGSYDLADPDHAAGFRDFLNLLHYTTSEELSGDFVIISMSGGRARGTFFFDAWNVDDHSDVIEVRNGEFDVEIIE